MSKLLIYALQHSGRATGDQQCARIPTVQNRILPHECPSQEAHHLVCTSKKTPHPVREVQILTQTSSSVGTIPY